MKNLKYILSICLLASLLCSCKKDIDVTLVKSIRLQDGHFTAIQADEAFEIAVVDDSLTFVEIECSAYLNDYIICKLEGEKLLLSVNKVGHLPLGTEYRAIVHTPVLQSISLTDASRMTIIGDFNGFTSVNLTESSQCTGGIFSGNVVNINLSDASRLIDFSFEGQELEAKLDDASRLVGELSVDGSSKIEIDNASCLINHTTASTNEAILIIKNASLLNMAKNEITRVNVELSSASEATLKVNEIIMGSVSEASTLYYYGSPHIDAECSDGSQIIRL